MEELLNHLPYNIIKLSNEKKKLEKGEDEEEDRIIFFNNFIKENKKRIMKRSLIRKGLYKKYGL
jgi:hypothetical protein